MLNLQELRAGGPFGTVLVDPPWRFTNRTGKVAPEHRRLRALHDDGRQGDRWVTSCRAHGYPEPLLPVGAERIAG